MLNYIAEAILPAPVSKRVMVPTGRSAAADSINNMGHLAIQGKQCYIAIQSVTPACLDGILQGIVEQSMCASVSHSTTACLPLGIPVPRTQPCI